LQALIVVLWHEPAHPALVPGGWSMTSERMVNWADRVAYRLIHRAAKRAPGALSERLEEEWLADLADRQGSLSRLRFAVGCCWATSVIAHDRELGLLPAAAGPVAGGAFGSGSSLPPAWRRTAAFIAVAGLHITVFYAFVIGLDVKFHPSHVGPMVAVPVPVVPKDAVPPPPPPPTGFNLPKIDSLPPDLPPLSGERDQITVETPPVVKNLGQDLIDSPHTPDPPAVKHVTGGPGSGFPIPDDYYPSVAIHMGETGAATVKVCVNSKGRLTSEPSIQESTGSSRLDGGAISLAKAGSGHYRPSTDDGRPVDSCYAFRVRFDLKN
jgi:TonB family protein